MKLILTSEVTGLGEPGDVVEVKDGYGRNYLIPRGLGLLWTRGGEKQIAVIKRARSARQVRDLGHAQEIKAAVESKQVTLAARAGDGGRLFGSITAGEVADAVKAASGQDLDRRRIELGHIKATGSHTATVRLHPEVVATIKLQVVAS